MQAVWLRWNGRDYASEDKYDPDSNIQEAFQRNKNVNIRLFLAKDKKKTTETDMYKKHSNLIPVPSIGTIIDDVYREKENPICNSECGCV